MIIKMLTEEQLINAFCSTNSSEPLLEGWPGLERYGRAVEKMVIEQNRLNERIQNEYNAVSTKSPISIIPNILGWQPVTSDSPPWNGRPVLVWRKKQGLWISSRLKNSRGYGADFYLGSRKRPPTHWMPLPEPPCQCEK